MSEVEVYQGQVPQTVAPLSGHELDVILRQAEMLAQSDIIPRDYRRKPANIVVAAMTGRTFGWDAITAMRNGHVIEGTWSIKPEAMLALVRRAGHSVQGEAAPDHATVVGKRCDTGDTMTVTFSMDDAQRAGLASKGTWKAYPQAMCWARAVSQLCRMLFADVTLGLSYTPEELGAEVSPDGEPIEVAALAPPEPTEEDKARPISAANAQALVDKCAAMGVEVADAVRLGTDDRTDQPTEVLIGEVRKVREALEFLATPPEPVLDADGFLAPDLAMPSTDDEVAEAELVGGDAA